MRLVIFGLTISSSWGNGHATLWRGLCRALRPRHEVVFYERDLPYYAEHRDFFGSADMRWRLYADFDEIRAEAARALAEADAGIVTSYCPDALAATRLVLDAAVPVRAFYDLDSPVTLAALAAGEPVAYVGPEGLGGFDVVLSYAGGPALAALASELGATRVAPLYGSVDPEVHHPVAPHDEFRADLSYLGTYASDRQEALAMLFLEPARRLPARKFLLGGAQYVPDFPWLANVWFAGHVAPVRHPEFFCSSRATVNVTRAAMAAMGYCPSGRLFEAAACGAPIVSDAWAGIEEFFRPAEEILLARSSDDVVAALELSDAELARVASRARERTLACHTAARRAEELIAILEDAAGAATADGTRAEEAPRCGA